MRWFAKNIRTFVLALVLAVAVWISAVTSADPDEVRIYPSAVPLEVVGQDSSLIITNWLKRGLGSDRRKAGPETYGWPSRVDSSCASAVLPKAR